MKYVIQYILPVIGIHNWKDVGEPIDSLQEAKRKLKDYVDYHQLHTFRLVGRTDKVIE